MAKTPLRSALVLAVSNHDERRARLLDLVERAGNRVLEALDGFHALALATRYVPDLLIADALLPQLDGLQLVARLKQSPDTGDIPAILVADEGVAAGVDGSSVAVIESLDDVALHMQRLLCKRTARPAVPGNGSSALAGSKVCTRSAAGPVSTSPFAAPRWPTSRPVFTSRRSPRCACSTPSEADHGEQRVMIVPESARQAPHGDASETPAREHVVERRPVAERAAESRHGGRRRAVAKHTAQVADCRFATTHH